MMKYEFTKDLETGNALIDREHKELFDAVNRLMEACGSGKGKSELTNTATFLESYVKKHFGDEERLQQSSKYPGITPHKTFHAGYCRRLDVICNRIKMEGPSVASLADLNREIGILISHIRTEDKRLAAYLREKGK